MKIELKKMPEGEAFYLLDDRGIVLRVCLSLSDAQRLVEAWSLVEPFVTERLEDVESDLREGRDRPE